MAQIKKTLPPMLGRSDKEKQEAAGLLDAAKAYLAEQKGEDALPFLRKGAELGHPPALLRLALLYLHGSYVEQNKPLAFELFWQAASHGHVIAQYNLAVCYYHGHGIERDYEEAVSWMTTAARTFGKSCAKLAEWYAAEPLNDPQQARYWRERAEAMERDDKGKASAGAGKPGVGDKSHDSRQYSHKKEFYRGSSYLADKRFFEYCGQIYYINTRDFGESKLCVSGLKGENARMLAELGDFGCDIETFIAVNCTGIYVYTREIFADVHVQKYDLSGNLAGKYKLIDRRKPTDEYFHNFYIYGHMVYCVLRRNGKDLILSLDTGTGEKKEIYDLAVRIDRLTASEDCLAFLADYDGKTVGDDGWMILDLATGRTRCLSNPQCSPENVLLHPEYYDEDSPFYREQCERKERDIAWIDLNRGIFWQNHDYTLRGGEGIIWRACSISDGQPRADIPEWRTAPETRYGLEQEYFDGYVHFVAPTYYTFWGIDRSGRIAKWPLRNGGHGECDRFTVMGGCLFMNADANDQSKYTIYPMSLEMPEPEGVDWFSDPLPGPEEARKPQEGDLPRQTSETEDIFTAPPSGSDGSWDLETVKTLGPTDIKYNICTFGSGFHIGFGMPVVIEINGKQYRGKMHNSTKGRLDGLKQLYTEQGLTLGSNLSARYSAKENTIYLTDISIS